MLKKFKVSYKSRYHPLEGQFNKIVAAENKKFIKDNWHDIINTDEYKIVKIEEVSDGKSI